MAVTRIADVIVPNVFTDYVVQNTMEKFALVQSGIMTRNAEIAEQLRAGADSFNVPFWLDLSDEEADIVNDDPDDLSVPLKISSGKQVVRKSFLHKSWSAMNLASELSGSDALARIQSRVDAYWTRQVQRRLIATLNGILADNVANDDGDMVLDVSGETGSAAVFGPAAVIDAAGTLGDQMGAVAGVAMHSDVFRNALKNDQIESIRDSDNRSFQTYRGMAVVVDDMMPVDRTVPDAPVYTTTLFSPGVIGWNVTAPRVADGTEIESRPSAGNGGGQEILHSRVNLALHPAGFSWVEGTVLEDSPSLAELALAANWNRIVDRKAAGLAFLKSRL